MSRPPQLRRTDRELSHEETIAALEAGYCGRLATIGADGYPYCLPLLYVWRNGEIFVHNAAVRGHLRMNVEHEARVCFEIDEAGQVFDYGRFECDSSVSYRSVIAFGRIRVVEDTGGKQAFCEALLAKYRKAGAERPKNFFPRLDQIAVYAIAIERMTGKSNPLPAIAEQWPAKDRTKTPDAAP